MKWRQYQLEARTAEEIEQIKTPAGMRQRIFRAYYDDPLIHRVLDLAMREGLSGEDTYTLLAYHALASLERMIDGRLEEAMMQPNPPIFVIPKDKL